jgi:glycopeptide antibiotics resistance protein
MLTDGRVVFALIVWTLAFLIAGLWPFRFSRPDRFVIYFFPNAVNGLLNFVCFLPFGFLIARLPLEASPILAATLYCFMLSFSVETAQLFLVRRYPSVADLVLNTLGGAVGAILFVAGE